MAEKTINTIEQQDNEIHKIGKALAEAMPNFYGKVILNIQGGKYVNANIERSIKPIISKGEVK
jgi:hypothetical protein